MFQAYNNYEKYAHMRRNRDLHRLYLTEKYEIKDTKLTKGNNSLHQHQQRHFYSQIRLSVLSSLI